MYIYIMILCILNIYIYIIYYIRCLIIFKGWGRGKNHTRMKLWYRGEDVLTKKVFSLTHEENIKKTKEVSRKPGILWLPVSILWNCMHQNITLTGRRESAKLRKSDLNNFGNFVELLWHETLRNMFRMPNDCFIFYCLSLDFFLWYLKTNCNID